MKKIFLSLLFLVFIVGQARASALSDAAASLSAGQWTVLTNSDMPGLDATSQKFYSGAPAPGPGYDATQPAWDSTAKKLYMEVTEHGAGNPGDCGNFPSDPHTCWKPLWTLNDATDTWTVDGAYPHYPNSNPVPGVHNYNMVAWDDVHQVMYVRAYWSGTANVDFFRYCVNSTPSYCATQGAAQWAQITSLFDAGDNCCEALAYDATYNGGALIYFTGAGAGGSCGAVYGFKEGTGWSTIDSGPACKYSTNGYSVLNINSPIKGVTVFGGGGKHFWKLISATGSIDALDDAPCDLGNTNNTFASVTADPVTGDIVAIGCTNAGQLWRLNPNAASGSQWSAVASSLNGAGEICNVARNTNNLCSLDFWATPISTYGVIAYWKYRAGSPSTAELWIYKVADSDGGEPPPAAPAAPSSLKISFGGFVRARTIANLDARLKGKRLAR